MIRIQFTPADIEELNYQRGIALGINGAVQILSSAFDFDVGFINFPRVIGGGVRVATEPQTTLSCSLFWTKQLKPPFH